jgi:hypothetical protein
VYDNVQSGRPGTATIACMTDGRQDTVGHIRQSKSKPGAEKMSIGMILLIVLVLALVGVLPTWGHSSKWGYGPSGGVGLIVVILIVLLVMGRI